MTRALAEAPRLAEARAREAAADGRRGRARRARRGPSSRRSGLPPDESRRRVRLPQPDGGVSVIFPDIPNNYRARAEVAVPVFTVRPRRRARGLGAKPIAARVGADGGRSRPTWRSRSSRAYWALVLARERVGVLDAALERSRRVARDVGARVDAGLLPPNDVLSAQAQRARQNVQLIQAQQRRGRWPKPSWRAWSAPSPGGRSRSTTPVDRPIAGAAELAALPVGDLLERAPEPRGPSARR